MRKSWLVSLLGLAILLILLVACIGDRPEDNSDEFYSDVPINLRGEYTEEELFGGLSDQEILAKFIKHVGGDYSEKEIVARIVVDYKNSGDEQMEWSDILGSDKRFYINYRYWINYVTIENEDLNIAKKILEEAERNDDLTIYTDYISVSDIENSPGEYNVFVEGREFKKTTHFYFVVNE